MFLQLFEMVGLRMKIKKVNPEAKLPIYSTDGAAGCDFYALVDTILEPGKTTKVSTGISLEIPEGYYLRIEDRSGLAIKGIHKVGGVIDSDYRGEVFVVLINNALEPYKIEKHDRIAQGIISPVLQATFEEVDSLSETKRGEGGFHSTGKK